MTLKRLFLGLLTAVVVLLVGRTLWASVQQPQTQSRLELYQTDLVLQAAQWQATPDLAQLEGSVSRALGENPAAAALKQYQEVRTSLQDQTQRVQALAQQLTARGQDAPQILDQLAALQQEQTRLDLRLGLLQLTDAPSQVVSAALATWDGAATRLPGSQLAETARILSGLWSSPVQLLPDAEDRLRQTLSGWFEHQALARLYEQQQRPDALRQLQIDRQTAATTALTRLAIVAGLPLLGSLAGLVLLLGFGLRRLLARKRSENGTGRTNPVWPVPWTWVTIWEVMTLWLASFLGLGQLLLPLSLQVLQLLELVPASLGFRGQAFYALLNYTTVVIAGVLILVGALRHFAPLPPDWFRLRLNLSGLLWGVGGYLSALPLVVGVSLLNERLLQGRGGGNPLLLEILENRDLLAKMVFLLMVTVAAPVFEETLFRGFLLPSLTRYLPVSGAIALSGVLFALAHLNLSDVLPLSVLGCVLGFVYLRSRNLFASMLLHSIWNGGSFLALLVLGAGE